MPASPLKEAVAHEQARDAGPPSGPAHAVIYHQELFYPADAFGRAVAANKAFGPLLHARQIHQSVFLSSPLVFATTSPGHQGRELYLTTGPGVGQHRYDWYLAKKVGPRQYEVTDQRVQEPLQEHTGKGDIKLGYLRPEPEEGDLDADSDLGRAVREQQAAPPSPRPKQG